MSGFVVLVERGGRPIDPTLLDRLTATLAFRGPDGSSTHIVGPAGLGATILRTTEDTRPETQPLSLDGECWIVGQVRLDARTDLRAELARAGERAAPDTPDLELLLLAWRVWGTDSLPRLYGDLSFALWDNRSSTLAAGRDAAGVRQLYWAEASGSVLLGNTLKCLLSHPDISNRLDPAAVGSWLAFGQLDTAEATFFPAVRRVPPAHLLTWRRESGVEVSRYWSLPVDGRLRISRPEEEIESFRTLFTAAVSDRIRTRGLGAHLSGGLDSSSIAVTAQRLIRDSPNPGKLRCYTGEYRHLILDEEGEYAALIARHAGLDQLRVPLDDLLSHPPIAPPHFLSPEPGTIPELNPESFMLADLVRFGRVMLSGSGGDPLFTRPQRPLVTLMRRGGLAGTVNAIRNCLAIGARPALAIRASLGIQAGTLRKPSDLPAFIRMEPAAWQRLVTINQRTWRDRATAEPSRLMLESTNASALFTAFDSESTGYPVEYRFPLYDRRIIEHLRDLSPIPWRTGKTLLRRTMAGQLPVEILARHKTVMPSSMMPRLERLARAQDWFQKLVSAPQLEPFVDPGIIADWLESGAPDFVGRVALFRVAALSRWLQYR